MREKLALRLTERQDDAFDATGRGALIEASDLPGRQGVDALTHARLWKNPCGFAARFNYLALRYNVPLYGWVKERFDLSRVEFVVIYNLAVAGPFTASEIAASTAFPKNTMSRAVNRLVKLGLIAREADGDDRRAQIMSLEPAGRAIFDEAIPRFAGLEQEMLASLNLVEREMLAMLLAKVVAGIFQPESAAGTDDQP